MIPSRPLLVLSAAVALLNAAACSRSEGAPRPAAPPAGPAALAFALEAPPAPLPDPVPDAAASAAADGEPLPTPEEVAAVERPRVAK